MVSSYEGTYVWVLSVHLAPYSLGSHYSLGGRHFLNPVFHMGKPRLKKGSNLLKVKQQRSGRAGIPSRDMYDSEPLSYTS